MRIRGLLGVVGLVVVTALVTSHVVSQDQSLPEMSLAEVMAVKKWDAFAAPGEQHQRLAERAGKWRMTTRIWGHDGAQPTESTASSTSELVMGGRYLLDRTRGEVMGETFEGLGLTGYDNLNQEFVSIWIDNLGTGFGIGRGTCESSGDICNYETSAPDPISGSDKTYRIVERRIDGDTWVMEMYDVDPDGEEFLSMEMKYRRAS